METQETYQQQVPNRTIFDLPQEIQNEVASYLEVVELSRLSQSCSALLDSTGPLLYKSITIAAPLKYGEREKCISSSPSSCAHLLLRTVSQNPKTASLIESLSLHRFSALHENFDFILNGTSNLSTLHLDYLLSQRSLTHSDRLDAATIPDALDGVRNTLTNLKITYQVSADDDIAPRIAGYCSFKIFTKLETLDIPWCVLFGNYGESDLLSSTSHRESPQLGQILPPGLTRLNFGYDGTLHAKTKFRFEFGKPYFIPQQLKLLWHTNAIHNNLLELVEDETWRRWMPNLEAINADMFDMRDDHRWKSLTGQNFIFLEEREADIKNMIVANGLKCETFRLHPSLEVDEASGQVEPVSHPTETAPRYRLCEAA